MGINGKRHGHNQSRIRHPIMYSAIKIPRAAQYVNSDGVLQQCILCRLDVAICLQSIKSGEFHEATAIKG